MGLGDQGLLFVVSQFRVSGLGFGVSYRSFLDMGRQKMSRGECGLAPQCQGG